MADTLDQHVTALKDWLSGAAWRHLADPSLTSFDRREIRHYMKDAESRCVPDLNGWLTVRQPGVRRNELY